MNATIQNAYRIIVTMLAKLFAFVVTLYRKAAAVTKKAIAWVFSKKEPTVKDPAVNEVVQLTDGCLS